MLTIQVLLIRFLVQVIRCASSLVELFLRASAKKAGGRTLGDAFGES